MLTQRVGAKSRSDGAGRAGRIARALAVCWFGAALGGCFQPLYGEHTVEGGSNIQAALNGVDVQQIAAPSGSAEARIAVELRDQLLFGLNGGGSSAPATHRLTIKMASTRTQVIVDVYTARPDVEQYGINANYELTDLKTGKVVVKDSTFSRVSYDIPGQQQRFAQARGLRDAENRAAQQIAQNIRARLASFFVAGT